MYVHVSADGQINTGAAIRFATSHFFDRKFGARGPNVPKSLSIVLDNNPTDDAIQAAREARDEGIEVSERNCFFRQLQNKFKQRDTVLCDNLARF